jgi:5-methylcytosine-specific restriction endonuclease McrA
MAESEIAKRNSALRNKHRARIARDKPACHICGKAIDYTLPHLDPWSFVLDHVKPLKLGGSDTLENKKAAHRECNSKKRARMVAPIVRRSGSLD